MREEGQARARVMWSRDRPGSTGHTWNEGGLGTGIADKGEPTARAVCSDAFRALRQPESAGILPVSKYDIVTLCPSCEEVVFL